MTTPLAAPLSTNTAPFDASVFPYLPPRDTTSRMRHFDTGVFNIAPSTYLYCFLDAACGDAGAGSLKKELLTARMQSNLDATHFTDLDAAFGNFATLVRFASESYPYDPANNMLTSDQWDEIKVKDAAYRSRIKNFLLGLGQGGTIQGFILMCRAATGYDSHLFETWKYIDDAANGLSPPSVFGRLGASVRNEVVVQPLTASLPVSDGYRLNRLLERIKPRETVVTIDVSGLAVHTQITLNAVGASDFYFQVEKTVTGVPDLANLPPTAVLAADLDPANQWLKPNVPIQAPYAAFNNSQESSVYYLYSTSGTTVIDTVVYSQENSLGNHIPASNFTKVTQGTVWGAWTSFNLADSPDNYPGGKTGQTPFSLPALTKTGSPYIFPYASQAAFVASEQINITALGGQFTDTQFRLPLSGQNSVGATNFLPTNAIPLTVPTKNSTVTTPWIRRPNNPAVLTLGRGAR